MTLSTANVRQLDVAVDGLERTGLRSITTAARRRIDKRQREPLPVAQQRVALGVTPHAEHELRLSDHLRLRCRRSRAGGPRPSGELLLADRPDASKKRYGELAPVDDLVLEHPLAEHGRLRSHD